MNKEESEHLKVIQANAEKFGISDEETKQNVLKMLNDIIMQNPREIFIAAVTDIGFKGGAAISIMGMKESLKGLKAAKTNEKHWGEYTLQYHMTMMLAKDKNLRKYLTTVIEMAENMEEALK